MDHLVCFVPAMLALGSHMGAVTGSKAEQYMQLAEKLTETCWQMYATQPTGRPVTLFGHACHCKLCSNAMRASLVPACIQALGFVWGFGFSMGIAVSETEMLHACYRACYHVIAKVVQSCYCIDMIGACAQHADLAKFAHRFSWCLEETCFTAAATSAASAA